MTRTAAVERALEYFDDSRYTDDLARRVEQIGDRFVADREAEIVERGPGLERLFGDERHAALAQIGQRRSPPQYRAFGSVLPLQNDSQPRMFAPVSHKLSRPSLGRRRGAPCELLHT